MRVNYPWVSLYDTIGNEVQLLNTLPFICIFFALMLMLLKKLSMDALSLNMHEKYNLIPEPSKS